MDSRDAIMDAVAGVNNLYDNLSLIDDKGSLAKELFSPYSKELAKVRATAYPSMDLYETEVRMKEENPRLEERAIACELAEIDATKQYEEQNLVDFTILDGIHSSMIKQALLDLGPNMINAGEEGYKLGVSETTPRLGPLFDMHGSSAYRVGEWGLNGKDTRERFSGDTASKFVTAQRVRNEASTIIDTYGAGLAIAETSAAPELRFIRSGKRPRAFIASIDTREKEHAEITVTEHQFTNTYLRAEFNCIMREVMFDRLRQLYHG